MYICMYVSHLGMQFTWWACYVACADGGLFVISCGYLVWTMKTMKKEVGVLLHYARETSSGSWSNDDPCCHSRGSHYTVHLSLRGRSRQLTRLRKFVKLEFQLPLLRHIPFFERCCGAKKGGMVDWASHVPPRAHECVPSLCIRNSSMKHISPWVVYKW